MRQRRHGSQRKRGPRPLQLEGLEPRTVLSSGLASAWDSTSPWQNPFAPADLSGDGYVSPLDVMLAINALNVGLRGPLADRLAPPALRGLVDGAASSFLDTDGDAQLTPADALHVINALNRGQDVLSNGVLPPLDLPIGEDQPESIGDDVATLELQQGWTRGDAQLASASDVDVFRVIPDQARLHAAVFSLSGAVLNVSIVDAAGNELGTPRTVDLPSGSPPVRDAWVTPGEAYFVVVSGSPAAPERYALQVINRNGDAGVESELPEIVVPSAATQFAVRLPPHVSAGVAVSVHAMALDASSQPVPTYAGTVRVTSSDPRAELPSQVTFQHGHAFFEVTWSGAGEQTLTLSDPSRASLTGSAATQVFVSAVVTQFAVGLPAKVPAGIPVTVQVLALDARNQPVPAYTGTVRVTGSDPQAVLPSEVTFQNGLAVLQVTFATPGEQTLTVTDRSAAALAATATTRVAAPPLAAQFALRLPPHVPAGTAVPVQIVALNARGQPVSAYAGTARVTSSDPWLIVPAEVLFRDGQATLNVTFVSVGTQTLTITDSLDLSLSGTAAAVVVTQPAGSPLPDWLGMRLASGSGTAAAQR